MAPYRGRVRSRSASLLPLVLLCCTPLMTGCATTTVTLPDLVGLPLDEAHRDLEALGFEKFDDRDAFEDRTIMLDANWVVIESTPDVGATVAIDETVTFSVGKRDEARAIELLPEDFPGRRGVRRRAGAEGGEASSGAGESGSRGRGSRRRARRAAACVHRRHRPDAPPGDERLR